MLVFVFLHIINLAMVQNNIDKQGIEGQGSIEFAIFGSGCFWCTEAIFESIDGVVDVESGYSGGKIKNPGYKEVCSGNTGHAEVVKISFNPKKVSFEFLLSVFFKTHDPTTLNYQGNDHGTQYRSVIFYTNEEQKLAAKSIIEKLNSEKVYDKPIVTELSSFDVFYKAEDYHQDYFIKNPTQGYCQFVVQPKVEKFRKVFKEYLK